MNGEKFMLQLGRIKKYNPVVMGEGEYYPDMIDDDNGKYIKLEDLFRLIGKNL